MMFKKAAIAIFMLFFILGGYDLAAAEKTAEPKSANAALQTPNNNKLTFKDFILPGAAGLLIIVGCGSYWLIYRRKHV